ncbi:hypothetical protein RvY_02397 [Ramazzottius varieornatus]|uniref:Uncharacterized protein n=1 Tax=Ramazzottius varieornatus TaxID=947166 RepID=A0A1D1UQG4_RAMVA|nr:hypothetical protein RvY_02397 [Ramazzottius varieornatus]
MDNFFHRIIHPLPGMVYPSSNHPPQHFPPMPVETGHPGYQSCARTNDTTFHPDKPSVSVRNDETTPAEDIPRHQAMPLSDSFGQKTDIKLPISPKSMRYS